MECFCLSCLRVEEHDAMTLWLGTAGTFWRKYFKRQGRHDGMADQRFGSTDGRTRKKTAAEDGRGLEGDKAITRTRASSKNMMSCLQSQGRPRQLSGNSTIVRESPSNTPDLLSALASPTENNIRPISPKQYPDHHHHHHQVHQPQPSQHPYPTSCKTHLASSTANAFAAPSAPPSSALATTRGPRTTVNSPLGSLTPPPPPPPPPPPSPPLSSLFAGAPLPPRSALPLLRPAFFIAPLPPY